MCYEVYKEPKMLSCGHSLCKTCTESWAKVKFGDGECKFTHTNIKIYTNILGFFTRTYKNCPFCNEQVAVTHKMPNNIALKRKT